MIWSWKTWLHYSLSLQFHHRLFWFSLSTTEIFHHCSVCWSWLDSRLQENWEQPPSSLPTLAAFLRRVLNDLFSLLLDIRLKRTLKTININSHYFDLTQLRLTWRRRLSPVYWRPAGGWCCRSRPGAPGSGWSGPGGLRTGGSSPSAGLTGAGCRRRRGSSPGPGSASRLS